MLTLNKRPAKIGAAVNTRCEKHGDEDVPACDIPLVGIMLEAAELNALLGDPYAHTALFNHRPGSQLDEPIFRKFNPLRLRDKFEEAEVVIYAGLEPKEIRLKAVKLARVTLDPQVGGLTELALQVQCTPETETIGELLAFMNHTVDVVVSFGKTATKGEKQSELPLNSFGDGESKEPAAETPKRGRRRNSHDQPSIQ